MPPRSSILVVENEQLVALDIQTRLESLGYGVVTAASGEEAIERAAQAAPDAVLMDIELGGDLDGIDAAGRIRMTHDVPVIYLTAYADNATVERARASEPYGYVLKPFDERELRATIEMALQRHWTDRYRREREDVQRFLADASVQLSESLDGATVVGRAAELLVPRYGESCAIWIDDERCGPPLTWLHPGGDGRARTGLQRGGVVASVLSTGRAWVEAELVAPAAIDVALGGDHADVVRTLGASPRALLAVPIPARGRTLGAIVLVSNRPERYTSLEVALAEDFGRRLGMAIDNAALYREAQRAIDARDEVLAVVSHDLRSPLGAIVMRAQLLEREAGARPAASAIVRSARRMNRMIGDLLDAATIDAGRLSVKVAPEGALDIAFDAVDALGPVAEDKSVALRVEHDGEPGDVSCDRDRILQVLSNLIDNSIKFTPPSGAVTLRIEVDGARVRFAVSDTGVGMDEDQLAHVFERFWRARANRFGAGLGLFIARHIVQMHGDDVRVTSRPGEGSTFTFALECSR